MSGVLQEIMTLLTAGISQLASGIGAGLQTLVTDIFLTGEGTQASPYALSVFGAVIIIFAGISLAVGLCRWVTNFVTSLGN